MFTGIISTTGRIVRRFPRADGTAVEIECEAWEPRPAPGDSVAVDGVCLTVTGVADRRVQMDLGAETLARTTAANWRTGRRVNLERPLRIGDPIGGHLVQGHVDATVQVRRVRNEPGGIRLTVALPAAFRPFLIERGSVALNGVSLTVTAVTGDSLEVFLIPFTLEATNLGTVRPGDPVNLELDPMGKYVGRWMSATRGDRNDADRPASIADILFPTGMTTASKGREDS